MMFSIPWLAYGIGLINIGLVVLFIAIIPQHQHTIYSYTPWSDTSISEEILQNVQWKNINNIKTPHSSGPTNKLIWQLVGLVFNHECYTESIAVLTSGKQSNILGFLNSLPDGHRLKSITPHGIALIHDRDNTILELPLLPEKSGKLLQMPHTHGLITK